MKKILILLFLAFLVTSCAKQTYEAPLKVYENKENFSLFKLDEATMENKFFLNDLSRAQFLVAETLVIKPETFDPYIDEEGIFILPSIRFTLNKDTQLFYQGKEEWKDQNNQTFKGYVFGANSGQRFMLIKKYSSNTKQILYFSLLEHNNQRYKLLSSSSTYLNCKIKNKIEDVIIK